jgi:hypothetical protein
MLPLKPSTHRKCFIDLKIRENSYPTAASLARDYRVKYGKKVDPRTIANDIADMRRELNAPIHYDSEKRGYVYTNSSFKANIFSDETADIPLGALGISGLSALGIDQELLPLIPSSVFLPEWHRNLLQTLAEKAVPAGRFKGRSLGKVTVVHREKTLPFPAPEAGNAVLEALEHNRDLRITYAGSGGLVREYRFQPCHLVYLKNEKTGDLDCFVLGEVTQGGDAPYALLNAAGIQTAGLLEGTFKAAKAVHVHQADDKGIEFLLVNEKTDTLLLFAPGNNPADDGVSYTDFVLLSRMDIYTGECNTQLPPMA